MINTKTLYHGILYTSLLLPISTSFAKITERSQKDTIALKEYQQEIAAIAENSQVKRAFQHILELESETRANHILLTEIPAPPFKEEKRAEKFAVLLQTAGVDSIWTDQAGNVIALRKGSKGEKTIAIEGHLDTVFPEGTDVQVKTKGDTLAAPGIGDDTRSLAVVITLLKAMNQAEIKTSDDILFIGTVGEEGQGDLRGMKELFGSKGPKIDTHIALDGTATDRIVNRGVGSNRYRVTFKSDGGHSYGSFGMVNTHVAMGKAIHYWSIDADKYTGAGGPKTTYSVSVVGGGTSVNSIPFESWMEVDMRSESGEHLQQVDTYLKEAVNQAVKEVNESKRHGNDLSVDFNMIGNRPSGGIELTEPLAQRMMAVIHLAGQTPKFSASSTNSNIPLSLGVPSITIGAGGIAGGAHSLGEWFVNKNGYVGIQNALLVLLASAGLN